MDKDIIMTEERKLDSLTLDGKFSCTAYLSIGLIKGGDFYLIIEFTGLDERSFLELGKLYKLEREIEIRSDLISKENYDITHIIVEKFSASNKYDLTWECLSDKPGPSLIL